MIGRSQIGDRGKPAGCRPGEDHGARCSAGHDGARRQRCDGVEARASERGGSRLEQFAGEMADAFAADRVHRFDGEGVQRPEIALRHSENRSGAKQPNHRQNRQQKDRPDADQRRGYLVLDQAQPRRGDQRREAEQQSRHDEQHRPGKQQLGRTDLGEQASRQRQHGAAFGAGGVVLDVAVAWISGFRGLARWTCEPGRWTLPVQGRPGMLNGCAAPLAPCGSGPWIGLSPR